MPTGFSIESVAIEGFKGFTTRQEIGLNGRHVFLLGHNGNGKSSVIEAIRWGLFGSARRQNEVIRNRGYAPCIVEIKILRESRLLNFRRLYLSGVSGGTDATLTDEHGAELSIREVMPQLDSVDSGEGMHIIFAPQSSPLSRQPGDLDSFERTVFNHLGLTHPRALISQLDEFLIGQELRENKLANELTKIRTNVNSEISQLERQRGYIVASPPWSSNHNPSVAESENNASALFVGVTGRPPDESLSGVSRLTP